SSLRGASPDLRAALSALRGVLTDGAPTLKALDGGLREVGSVSGDVDRLTRVLAPAAPALSEGFFVNFADQGAEPGRQPFDPFADPRRNYWRGAAVMSCEAFGVPVAPGCLQRVLAQRQRRQRQEPKLPAGAAPALTPAKHTLDYLLGR